MMLNPTEDTYDKPCDKCGSTSWRLISSSNGMYMGIGRNNNPIIVDERVFKCNCGHEVTVHTEK